MDEAARRKITIQHPELSERRTPKTLANVECTAHELVELSERQLRQQRVGAAAWYDRARMAPASTAPGWLSTFPARGDARAKGRNLDRAGQGIRSVCGRADNFLDPGDVVQ